MKCFYAPETKLHDPKFRISAGKPGENAEKPARADVLLDAIAQVGLTAQSPAASDRDLLAEVHDPRLLTFLETAWDAWQTLHNPGPEVVGNVFPDKASATYPEGILGRAGWHMGDTAAPLGPHSWQASLRAADCAVAAAEAVLNGDRAAYALTRPPGHHSSQDRIAGHCLLNVAAIAATRLRRDLPKVAILDIDVHHGNGTQAIFYDRADVLTVSVHADPSAYYPFFNGYAHETGQGPGDGFNLNLPLSRETGDDGWLRAIATGLDRVAEDAPDALVVSLGLDAHENDPLQGMKVTWDGFRGAGSLIADAGLPTVLIQEGGYLSDDLTKSLVAFMQGMLGKPA